MSKKTESPETTVPDEVAVLPCVGACRGDETEHEILTPKMARCSVCKHERNTLVGAGSPAGPRWFVTKYPSWTATIIPEDYLLGEGGRTVKQKALRAVFNDGAGLAGHGLGLGIVATWGLAAFLLAVKRFRWA